MASIGVRRLAVLGAFALSAGLSSPAVAAKARPRPPAIPVFAGVTTFTTSTAGYVRVSLPRAATLPFPTLSGKKDSIKVTGGGRAVLFAIVQEAAPDRIITGGHSAATQPWAAYFGEYYSEYGGIPRIGEAWVLPAGVYRLYLVPDGKPAQLTVRFKGAGGRTDLKSAVRRAHAVFEDLRLDPATTKSVMTYGSEWANPTSQTLWFSIATMKLDRHMESAGWVCEYEGKPAGPNPYLPGCPTLNGSHAAPKVVSFSDWRPDEERTLQMFTTSVRQPGEYGAGATIMTSSFAMSADAKQVWLQL